jgi:glycosyltransferase involved in cell wall biosynthesis
VARYAQELWRHLELEPSVEVTPFQVGLRIARPAGVRHLRAPMRVVHAAWRFARAPAIERMLGDVDIVHSIDLIAPPTKRPVVVTLHDALAVSRPELFSPWAQRSMNHVARQAHRAAGVVTTCETTADDIASALGLDRRALIVAPPGRSPLPPPGATPVVAERYVLAVGAVTPRKGYEVLSEAAAMLGDRCPLMLIAGPDYWRADAVREEVERHDRLGRIRFLGRVDEATLATLYEHAALVCHPSLAEGFGFPCLEAMEAGAPIVASDLPSIREMTMGEAVLVPAGDPDALAHGITELLDDDARRAALRVAGRARAATYTWSRTASIIAAAYPAIAAERRRTRTRRPRTP